MRNLTVLAHCHLHGLVPDGVLSKFFIRKPFIRAMTFFPLLPGKYEGSSSSRATNPHGELQSLSQDIAFIFFLVNNAGVSSDLQPSTQKTAIKMKNFLTKTSQILYPWSIIATVFVAVSIFIHSCPVFALEHAPGKAPAPVIIAYNVGNPPLKFKNGKRADGILIDIWRLWSSKTGVPVKFKEALFADTLEMLKTGKADIHAGLFYTKDRDRFLDYTAPILAIDYFIYHHESLKGIDAIDDYFPYRVGVPKGYTRTFMQDRLPDAALSVYDNYPLLFDAAMENKIHVFISPVMNHDYYFQAKKRTSPFRHNPAKPLYHRVYMGAVRQGETSLLNRVNQGLEKITPEEIIAIQRKWLKRTGQENIKETYIVACDSNYAPLSMLNEKGEPAGLFINLWQAWAKKQGVRIKFIFNNWDGSIRAVEQGLADFHSGFEPSQDTLAASIPFYELSAKVFVPAGNGYTSIFELNNKRIASLDMFYAQQLKKKNPTLTVVMSEDFNDIFGKLSRGEVDGFIDDELVVEDLLFRQGRQGDFKTIADFSFLSTIGAVTLKKNSRLLDFINQGLSALRAKELRQMEDRWLKEPDLGYYHALDSPVELTAREKEWLKTHQTLKIGVDPRFHPFEFIDGQGHYAGAAADYMSLIENRLGIDLQVLPDTSWQKAVSLAKQKKLDLLPAVTPTPDRSEFLNFTQAYLKYPIVIATRKETPPMAGLGDLSGIKTALVNGYASTELVLKHQKDVVPIFVDTVYKGLESLILGKADAYVGDVATIYYQMHKYNLINLKINARTGLETEGLAIGVRKDYPLLVSILNRTLSSITTEEHNTIRKKWARVELPGSDPETSGPSRKIKITLTPKEKDFIRSHPVIRIAGDPQFFPFEFFDKQGNYAGIASDYVALLNKRLGLNMSVVPDLSWFDAVEKARKKEIDVLPCIGVTRERLGFLKFSDTYISRYVVIITRTDAPLVLRLADLKSRKVAVRQSTFHEGFLKDRTDIAPVRYKSFQKGLLDLSAGKVDAMVGDVSSTMFWIRKLNLTNLKVAAPATYEPQTLHFGVRKDWPELVSLLNKGLSSITTEEENDILDNWVSVKYDPGLDPAVMWRYVRRILAGAAFVFAVFFLWSFSLKKEINERKKAEKKIQEYARELKRSNINLESLDKLKSMFIASMSHELRTPLNSIIGFTGVILQGMSGELNERQKDQLTRVYKSAKHLLNLISDVIDISKIEAGRIDIYPEPFNLKEIVNEAVINIQPLLNAKPLALSVEVPDDIIMKTDRKRLLQCLINYLGNAIKYTEQGQVMLRATPSVSHVSIEVEDTGIGIAEKDIPKLFNAFERIDSHLRIKAGGTGLGLYLTRKLVTDILNGTTMVKSVLGKGSTFGLTIPKNLDVRGEKAK